MKDKDVIRLLEKIDNKFASFIESNLKRVDRYNESYFNGYNACCDDLHYEIHKIINEISLDHEW